MVWSGQTNVLSCHVERTLSVVEGVVETSQKRSFGFAQDDLVVSLFIAKATYKKKNIVFVRYFSNQY